MEQIKRILTILTFLFFHSIHSFACDGSTIVVDSQTDNGDGTTTYCLTLTTELGGLDLGFYGFVLQFNSASNTPSIVSGSYPISFPASGNLTEPLTATTGALINSIVNDSDWNIYENQDNVLSYEDGSIFGAASDDVTFVLCVDVDGCVEEILYDSSPNSGASACEIVADLGISCAMVPSPCECGNPICGGAHFDCPSEAEDDYNDIFSTAALYDINPDLPASSGTSYELCWEYTTGPAETQVGFLNAIGILGPGNCFTRTFHVYDAGCGTEVLSDGPTPFGNGNLYTVSANTSYSFCVDIEFITNDCSSLTENWVWLYDNSGGSTSCGTCASPDCPIGDVPTYDDRSYLTCWAPDCPITGPATVTNCFSAISDASGFLGFANIIDDGSPLCFPGDITITWELQEASDCGNIIPNPVPNANGVSSGFNPEYSDLTPNANYTLCVTYDIPGGFDCSLVEVCVDYYGTSCGCNVQPSSSLPCDDGDPCTTGEMETTLDCDGTVCIPCGGGTVLDCASGPSSTLPCDDGDPCTSGETVTTLDCDGSVCIPCGGGTVLDCASGPTVILPCDDGNPCTVDDEQEVLQCNITVVCVPCSGTIIDCSNGSTITLPCDDGNPCTSNDQQEVLDCDNSIVCVPCQGIINDCSTGPTVSLPCDDGNDCTINDTQEVLDCDNSVICVPCIGIQENCSTPGATTDQPCNDGDPTTTNDTQTILNCDNSICIPCQGTPGDCSSPGATIVQVCDDGNSCTIDDEETVLISNGSICIPCQGTPIDCSSGPTFTLPCDDGNPCTINDQQEVMDCDNSIVCTPCQGTSIDCSSGPSITLPCNDGDPCTINDQLEVMDCDNSIVCIPCQGTPIDCSIGPTITLPCDDGNPCTFNDQQEVLQCDINIVCVPCLGVPVDCSNAPTISLPCDDNDPCTINDEQSVLECDNTITCGPCIGVNPTDNDCSNLPTVSLPCDDGNPCTINDTETVLTCDNSIVCLPCQGTLITIDAPTVNEILPLCIEDEIAIVTATGNGNSFLWYTQDPGIGGISIFEGNPFTPSITGGLPGIYTFWVSTSLNDCESPATSFEIELYSAPEIIEFTAESPSCFGQNDGFIIIDSIIGGQAPYEIFFNGTSYGSQTSFNILSSGNYEITIIDANQCQYDDEFILEEPTELNLELTADLELIQLGGQTTISAFINLPLFQIDTIIWTNLDSSDCESCLDQVVTPLETTTYSAIVTDISGCTSEDEVTIIVSKTRNVYIPNAFSPNDDGFNDFFTIYGTDNIKNINTLRIFDRWGAEIFRKDDLIPNIESEGWDGRHKGKLMNPAVFAFYAEIEFIDGRVEIYPGSITLLK